jgi:hypothetical protein
MIFDKLPAWWYIVAHQHRENMVGFGGIFNGNLL